MSVLNEFPWKPWLFPRVPDHFWENLENQRKFMEWLANKLNINKIEGWYSVTQKVRNQFFLNFLLIFKS